jgi:hypothetical protein
MDMRYATEIGVVSQKAPALRSAAGLPLASEKARRAVHLRRPASTHYVNTRIAS